MTDPDRSLRAVNLNLLPVLRAVLKHRNLTRAAEELNITQSGVSNSLKQLRDHFGDELLVRDGRGLRLTEKAKQLVEPLDAALAAVQTLVANAPFDPRASTRRFRIATADYVAATTAPQMAAVMAAEAPHISLQMVTARGRSMGDLRAGNVDMVISPRQIVDAAIYGAPAIVRDFSLEPLMTEPFVCMARDDDETFAQGLSIEAYLARPHATFHLDLETHASLEHGYLLGAGVQQFDRILTSDFTVLPLIAARSDCIVLAPRSLATLAARALPLRIMPSPLPIPDLELVMIWRRRRGDDPELAWLRSVLKRCVEGVLAEPYQLR
jgi:LysR family transcriptional regulator, nod-box dependent transcriptional activator